MIRGRNISQILFWIFFIIECSGILITFTIYNNIQYILLICYDMLKLIVIMVNYLYLKKRDRGQMKQLWNVVSWETKGKNIFSVTLFSPNYWRPKPLKKSLSQKFCQIFIQMTQSQIFHYSYVCFSLHNFMIKTINFVENSYFHCLHKVRN